MEFLDAMFNLWLSILTAVVADPRIGAMFWVFILAMTILMLIKVWRGAWLWK